MSTSTKNKHNNVLMFILTLGVFEILNTEMGVVGIIPIIAETFGVTVPDAGWTVSLFALIIAFSAPVVPLLFSRINRKTVMVLALSVFVISNFVSIFTTNFTVLLITRAIPAFFHPLLQSFLRMLLTHLLKLQQSSDPLWTCNAADAPDLPRSPWQWYESVFLQVRSACRKTYKPERLESYENCGSHLALDFEYNP